MRTSLMRAARASRDLAYRRRTWIPEEPWHMAPGRWGLLLAVQTLAYNQYNVAHVVIYLCCYWLHASKVYYLFTHSAITLTESVQMLSPSHSLRIKFLVDILKNSVNECGDNIPV